MFLWFALFLMLRLRAEAGVPLQKFFEYGTTLDNEMKRGEFSTADIQLDPPFKYNQELCEALVVRKYGAITFKLNASEHTEPLNFVSTFIDNADNGHDNYIGRVFYRLSNSTADITKARNDLNSAFQIERTPQDVKWILVATWENFAERDRPCHTNTFQVILVTDGHLPFVMVYYNKISMLEENMLKMVNGSNVFAPGKWIYRVDHGKMYGSPVSPRSRKLPADNSLTTPRASVFRPTKNHLSDSGLYDEMSAENLKKVKLENRNLELMNRKLELEIEELEHKKKTLYPFL